MNRWRKIKRGEYLTVETGCTVLMPFGDAFERVAEKHAPALLRLSEEESRRV
jgi:hypothetical protein